MSSLPLAIAPGHGLDFFTLGASLHAVLTVVKRERDRFPAIDLHFSQTRPQDSPIVLLLPHNGIRLRFDGADQRLCLIEVLDFAKARLVYKGSDLVKRPEKESLATFKRIYQLFGASYPGEYLPPTSGRDGTYILSWPGVAFTFALQHAAWSPDKDHVSLLGSDAASHAKQMAIFEGNSWPEIRNTLFVRTPSAPRVAAIASQPRDALAPEIELAVIEGAGRIQFLRRSPALPFTLVLGQTTLQDLLTDLGAPEAVHTRDMRSMFEPDDQARGKDDARSKSRAQPQPTPPSSYSSTGTDTFDTDFDSGDAEDDYADRASREFFWCYFDHGVDILVGQLSDHGSPLGHSNSSNQRPTSSQLVVLKVVIHGNVPGSYAFNRHRRLRWSIEVQGASSALHSEHSFDDIKPDLLQAFHGAWPENEMGRGKVVNRTWGADPSESSFFLPDSERDLVDGGGSEQWLGNTKLYSFPGLTFEVLAGGSISTLTVSLP